MSQLRSRLTEQFRDYEYRHTYCEDFLNTWIATQIKVLREQRGLSQAQLAALIGVSQPAISAHENPDKSSWSLSTLRKVARALDLALVVKFESFGHILNDITHFNRSRLLAPSFEHDPTFKPGATSTAPNAETEVQRDQTAVGRVTTTTATGVVTRDVTKTNETPIIHLIRDSSFDIGRFQPTVSGGPHGPIH